MNKAFLLLMVFAASVSAQVPIVTNVQILKAEDARRYDKTLEDLLKNPSESVRERAALAAGRIGDEKAVAALVKMLNDASPRVRKMAAFALGEIESIRAADAVVRAIGETGKVKMPGEAGGVDRSRLVEAAGKIAAANAKEPGAKDLAAAIIFTLEAELAKAHWDKETIMLGLTAVSRGRPEKGADTVRKFLAFTDPDIVATALNTLTRLRAKNANRDARDLLTTHIHAVVRANAARVLGAAEDKEAIDVLIKVATTDIDPRVRVAAIRSLGSLKDAKAGGKLIENGEALLLDLSHSRMASRNQKNELLEIATALGRLLANTRDTNALRFLDGLIDADRMQSAEPLIARLRISPGKFDGSETGDLIDWRKADTLAQVLAEVAAIEKPEGEGAVLRQEAPAMAIELMKGLTKESPKNKKLVLAYPAALRAYAVFKPADVSEVLRAHLDHPDIFVRATAAELIAEQPFTQENFDALNAAFEKTLLRDTAYNDAILAMIDGLFKLDKRQSLSALALASGSLDHLVRQKVLTMLKDESFKNVDTLPPMLRYADQNHLARVRPHAGVGTKLGQVLSKDTDYRRAALRKNWKVKAVLTTEKGMFTIDLLPEDAPLTVDNFIKLARSNYFGGLEVHRVVPNFVMQDGDSRGDGNGGPGWSIRCEVNMVPYERGAVGMALSGKDTGGSQWFVTHSPQPHLDGGYTVFGKVNGAGMKVVDNIVRGDKITSVRILGDVSTQRSVRSRNR